MEGRQGKICVFIKDHSGLIGKTCYEGESVERRGWWQGSWREDRSYPQPGHHGAEGEGRLWGQTLQVPVTAPTLHCCLTLGKLCGLCFVPGVDKVGRDIRCHMVIQTALSWGPESQVLTPIIEGLR